MGTRVPGADVGNFGMLEDTPPHRMRRWVAFGIGVGSHLLVLGLVTLLGVLIPSHIDRFVTAPPLYIEVLIPAMPSEVPRLRQPKRVPRLELPTPRPLQIQAPVTPPPRPAPGAESPKALVHAPPIAVPPSPAASAEADAKRQSAPVRTGIFSGSSAVATLMLPAREVQTGGFGSPGGLPGEAQGGSRGNVAKLGSFDLPSGAGFGNGSGGTHGAPGTVASAGFSSGIATPGEGDAGERGSSRRDVRPSGFDIQPDAQAPAAQPRAPQSPPLLPVEILSKPNPVYAEEARKLGVQGEVVLSVVFTASGELRVLRVVQGLGHGLDEAAWSAAEQIRFKPAQRDGQPVDFPATLRVVFQLAG